MKKSTKVTISMKIDQDVLKRLDRLANKADLDRTRFLTNMITTGIETFEDCEKVGILQFGLLMRDLGEDMKKWASRWKKRKVEIT